MIYAIGLGSNLNSRYGTQYQTLKKTINFIKKKNIQVLKTINNKRNEYYKFNFNI